MSREKEKKEGRKGGEIKEMKGGKPENTVQNVTEPRTKLKLQYRRRQRASAWTDGMLVIPPDFHAVELRNVILGFHDGQTERQTFSDVHHCDRPTDSGQTASSQHQYPPGHLAPRGARQGGPRGGEGHRRAIDALVRKKIIAASHARLVIITPTTSGMDNGRASVSGWPMADQ